MDDEIVQYSAKIKKEITDFVFENDFMEDTFLRINILDIEDVKAVFLEEVLATQPDAECYIDIPVLDLVVDEEVSYDKLELDDDKIKKLAIDILNPEKDINNIF